MSGERLANDPAFITESGITHVLNLTQAPSNPDVIAIARCHTSPLADTTSQELLPVLPEAIAFIGERIGLFLAWLILADEARQSGGKVLVHCFAGVSRSAAVAIAYLMTADQLSLAKAYDIVRVARACISPNLNFMGQLQKYEKAQREARGEE